MREFRIVMFFWNKNRKFKVFLFLRKIKGKIKERK